MDSPNVRRTAKKLMDTKSFKGDDFCCCGDRSFVKKHTNSMRRLNNRAIVRQELDALDAEIHEDNKEAELRFTKDERDFHDRWAEARLKEFALEHDDFTEMLFDDAEAYTDEHDDFSY